MGDAFFFVRGVLGASFVSQRDFTRLSWFLYGQKVQEGLESSSLNTSFGRCGRQGIE